MESTIERSIRGISELISRFPSARRFVVDGNPASPTLWIDDQNGSHDLRDGDLVEEVLQVIRGSVEAEDDVALTSAGVVSRGYAIDGVGYVTVRFARGASRSAVITIETIQPAPVDAFRLPESVVAPLMHRPQGVVLVGGQRELAVELARSLVFTVAQEKVDLPGAVIAERPLARPIARTPMLWLRCNARTGITSIEDAAQYASSFARLVLLDGTGESLPGVIRAVLDLADAGALVIAAVPGSSVLSLLDRWRVGSPRLGVEGTWIATLTHLRAVIAVDAVAARHGPETISEWLVGDDPSVRVTLGREGPVAVSALFQNRAGGSLSRDVAIDRLRASGRLV